MAAGWFDKPDLSETRHELDLGARRGPSGGQEYGAGRLRVSSPPGPHAGDLAAAVMDAVEDFRVGPPMDDTAVLVVRVTEQPNRSSSELSAAAAREGHPPPDVDATAY